MIHPTLLKYAELYTPHDDKEEQLATALYAKEVLLSSFENQVEIDLVNWFSMARVIGDPNIHEHDFGAVYEEGWEGKDYLYETLLQLTIDPDFESKKLEDYL